MALFKKSAEEVLKLFNQLSDEDKAKVLDGIKKPAEETKEQVAEAEKDVAEKGADEQTEKDRVDESVGEQEKLDGDEDSQTAKDRVDESEGETEEDEKDEELEDDPAATPEVEEPTEEVEVEADKQPAPGDGTMENPKDEVHEALNARIAAIEETLQRVLEKLENQDFGGIKANSTEKVEDDALSEDDRIMRSYYGNSYRR